MELSVSCEKTMREPFKINRSTNLIDKGYAKRMMASALSL